MATITVAGTGYVGLVSGACLADFGNTVVCVDNNASKIETLRKGGIPIYEPGLEDVVERNIKAGRLSFSTDMALSVKKSDVVFIAVGTPPADDGSADLKYVEAVAREVARAMNGYKVIVDKSTVPVGTGRRVMGWISDELSTRGADAKGLSFDVVSNPEFLREGSAVQDFMHPDRVVIGAETDKARTLMKDVYRSLYINETPYIETNIETAEMIKYASNSFLAVKITFINEVANLCEKVGANVQDTVEAAFPRIRRRWLESVKTQERGFPSSRQQLKRMSDRKFEWSKKSKAGSAEMDRLREKQSRYWDSHSSRIPTICAKLHP